MTDFNDQFFEKRLLNLKETQDSITGLSAWCLQHRDNHKAIVGTWLKVLKKVKIDQRLTLFYLANDVIQYSKRKSLQFVESWGTALQKATTLVRDDKVKSKILRLFKIWNERSIYDEVFLSDLCGLLTTSTKKNNHTESAEFQPGVMFEKMRRMELLEDSTNEELTAVGESPLPLNDVRSLGAVVKERRSGGHDVEAELAAGASHLGRLVACLRAEVGERGALLELLEQGEAFYESQKKEAKVVSNAYKNFGSRVKAMKRKLDELVTSLPSPVPSPDVNAPSPSPHDDIDLPEPYDPAGLNSTTQYAQYNTTTGGGGGAADASDFYTPAAAATASQNNAGAAHQVEYTPTASQNNTGAAYQEEYTPRSVAQNNSGASYQEDFTPTESSCHTSKNVGYQESYAGADKAGSSSSSGYAAAAEAADYSPPTFAGGFASFMGSATLPFDIQKTLFSAGQDSSGPRTNETNSTDSYEGNKIEVIGSTQPAAGAPPMVPPPAPQSSPQASLASLLSLLKQPGAPYAAPVTTMPPPSYAPLPGAFSAATDGAQYTPSPVTGAEYTPPVPTPAPYTPGASEAPGAQFTPAYPPSDPDFTASIPVPPPRVSPSPLPPPPMPPSLFDLDEEFKPPPWLLNAPPPPLPPPTAYASPPPEGGPPDTRLPPRAVNPLPAKFPTWDALESPTSPPLAQGFELVAAAPSASGDYEDAAATSVDVDDRSLAAAGPRPRQDTDQRHRGLADTDQRASRPRNLISLTGSPQIDTDYRGPASRSNSLDQCDSNGKPADNTESVDMDLSDGEETGKAHCKGGVASVPSESDGLDIDPALILLDPRAEKLLSSIDMEALSSLRPRAPPRPRGPPPFMGPRFRPRRGGGPPRFPPPGLEMGGYRPRW